MSVMPSLLPCRPQHTQPIRTACFPRLLEQSVLDYLGSSLFDPSVHRAFSPLMGPFVGPSARPPAHPWDRPGMCATPFSPTLSERRLRGGRVLGACVLRAGPRGPPPWHSVIEVSLDLLPVFVFLLPAAKLRTPEPRSCCFIRSCYFYLHSTV